MTTLKAMRDYSLIYVNGERVEVTGDDGFLMLADWLRKRRGLPGTKIVCAEGDCGACTVLQASPHDTSNHAFKSVNACITMVAQMDCSSIVTVEGLALGATLHPAQTAMMKCHGSQCGFCTPGFVVALANANSGDTRLNPISGKNAQNTLTGNLCRCTGYLPIQQAAVATVPDPKFDFPKRYFTAAIKKDLCAVAKEGFVLASGGRRYAGPASLKSALAILSAKTPKGPATLGNLRLVAGGTDLGVQANKGKLASGSFLSLQHVSELHEVKVEKGRISVGAMSTLEQLRKACLKADPELASLLDIFASPQIKHVATLVGNIANGSPIGDTMPHLLAADATVHIAGAQRGKLVRRTVALANFYTGYRKNDLKPTELITHVVFNAASKHVVHKTYKASQRKDLDISAVSASFRACVKRTPGGKVTLSDVRAAFGGVAATPVRLPQLELALNNQSLAKATAAEAISGVVAALHKAIKPIDDARASALYRRLLAENFLRRFFEDMTKEMTEEAPR